MPYPGMGPTSEKLPNGDIFIANYAYWRPENYNYILYILKNTKDIMEYDKQMIVTLK